MEKTYKHERVLLDNGSSYIMVHFVVKNSQTNNNSQTAEFHANNMKYIKY